MASARGPVVSVIIPSARVDTTLPACLRSLAAQVGAPPFEVVVASARAPDAEGLEIPIRWVESPEANIAMRRNRAVRLARGSALAFIDDDATAEPGWLAAGVRALESAEVVGGPSPGGPDAPYGERLADLLLGTPWIGGGTAAFSATPRAGPVRFAHDIPACNLLMRRDVFDLLGGFDESLAICEDTDLVRRAMHAGVHVVFDPTVGVCHRRRGFPGAYLLQRWRYRNTTGRMLFERPGLHSRGMVASFLAVGSTGLVAAAVLGGSFFVPAAMAYVALTVLLSSRAWRRDPALLPAVPLAFALHHATYYAALVSGMLSGAIRRCFKGRVRTRRSASPNAPDLRAVRDARGA